MPEGNVTFWREFDKLREAALAGDRETATRLLERLSGEPKLGDAALDSNRRGLLEQLASAFDLDLVPATSPAAAPTPVKTPSPATDMTPQRIDTRGPDIPAGDLMHILPEGKPGVSLVTCCMNRDANLIRAIDSWTACDEINEIIIVDWSSNQDVRTALDAAGKTDPRIRVIRVDGEPRWILSYAFNIGFRVASHEKILKTDADIVLDPTFFAQNPLEPSKFIAGNWRTADADQSHVNGFFYVWKSDLSAIAGFNEFITTYGWDDDDIYERLQQNGATRQDVTGKTIFHLPHTDEERVGSQHDPSDDTPDSARTELNSSTMLKIRRNRLIACLMPYWDARKTVLPITVHQGGSGDLKVRRTGWMPHVVPEHVQDDTSYYASLELTSWKLGQRVLNMTRDRLNLLLRKPFADLGELDVELALSNVPAAVTATGGYLVIRLTSSTMPGNNDAGRALDIVVERARAAGLSVILNGPFTSLPESASDTARALPFVPDWYSVGKLDPILPAELSKMPERRPGHHFLMPFNPAQITELLNLPPAAPAHQIARNKIYIDAQHGLGNRMRAIGSAAAFAEETDRDLVIVWEADDHSDCAFSDLFDYDGPVIDRCFVDTAADQGCQVYNYMEIEEGADKGAELKNGDRDIYARSAFVLTYAGMNWEAENRFLKALRPVQAVRDMVGSVRSPNDVSAHVRMAGGKDYEHLAYESADNWTQDAHDAIAFWREKSHFSHFLKRLEALTKDGLADKIFLAADAPETYRTFTDCFGDRVAMLERDVYDRSARQLQYALADAILLGRAPRLLGSTWSSFSELAMRMSEHDISIEMSGKDF